jgi:hypothetical protein
VCDDRLRSLGQDERDLVSAHDTERGQRVDNRFMLLESRKVHARLAPDSSSR